MNAAQAREEARRKTGLDRSRSERMAEWLEREWAALEAVEDKLDPAFGYREDEWLERLRKYEAQCAKERRTA